MSVRERLTAALSDRYRLDRELGAAVLPGPTFTLGAQVPLFNTSAYASNTLSVNYDVSADGQRFLFLRLLEKWSAELATALVQITNWWAEVRAKLAGNVP